MSLGESIGEANSKASNVGEKYLKTSYKYYKLKIFQQLTISISIIFKAVAIGGLLLLGLSFLAIAMVFSIGKTLDSYTLGFVVVGLIFVFFSVIVFLLRKHINNLTVKKISKKFFN